MVETAEAKRKRLEAAFNAPTQSDLKRASGQTKGVGVIPPGPQGFNASGVGQVSKEEYKMIRGGGGIPTAKTMAFEAQTGQLEQTKKQIKEVLGLEGGFTLTPGMVKAFNDRIAGLEASGQALRGELGGILSPPEAEGAQVPSETEGSVTPPDINADMRTGVNAPNNIINAVSDLEGASTTGQTLGSLAAATAVSAVIAEVSAAKVASLGSKIGKVKSLTSGIYAVGGALIGGKVASFIAKGRTDAKSAIKESSAVVEDILRAQREGYISYPQAQEKLREVAGEVARLESVMKKWAKYDLKYRIASGEDDAIEVSRVKNKILDSALESAKVAQSMP